MRVVPRLGVTCLVDERLGRLCVDLALVVALLVRRLTGVDQLI